MELQHKITSVISLILITALLFYCSTLEMRSTQNAEEGGAWYSRSDTIYFWYSDEDLTDYVNKAAVSFGEENNVHVLPMLITHDDYLEAVNEASIANNELPDAYIIGHESLEMAYLAGLAVPINDPERLCSKDNFSQAALNAVTYSDKLVGYPLSYDTCALVYNEDYLHDWANQKALAILKGEGESFVDGEYFEEIEIKDTTEGESSEQTVESTEAAAETVTEAATAVTEEVDYDYDNLSEEEQASLLASKTEEVYAAAIPETLNELLTIADSYSAPAGVDGVMSWDVSDILFNFWIVGDVVDLGGESGDDKNNIVFNNTETVNALLRYQHLHQFFNVESALNSYDKVINDFINGKMIFTICSVDGVEKLKEAKDNGTLQHEYGFASIPEVDENTLSRSMSMTEVVVVNGYSEKKDIANAFARYLTCEFAGELYARTGKAACNIHANEGYENLDVFDTEYADSVPLPKIIELENFWMELEALFARVWNGEDVATQLQGLDDTVRLFFTR
ncbi:MAG: extracellular solute-binding protein [Lachnospiraceae bacterium]|nr:extracellular solute-binding protein [Lachnospiraceae bacterium]